MNRKNIERVLKTYTITIEELKERLSVLPNEYRKVFEAKWGIDEAGNYCPTFTLLAKKLECDKDTARIRLLEVSRLFENRIPILLEMYKAEAYNAETICIASSYAHFYKVLVKGEISENSEKPSFLEFKKFIDISINNSLTEREKNVIIKRFGLDDGRYKSLEETSLMYDDVTRERIRQIEAKALMKLRQNRRKKSDSSNKEEILKDESKTPDDSSSIAALSLSERAYKCLRRAGIDTVEELISMTVEELMRVRNLGRRSFEEILKSLEMKGLKLNEE